MALKRHPLDLRKSTKIEETWLTSYSDLMTNLLVFFTLLISTSHVSSLKFEKLKEAFQGPTEGTFSIAKIHDEIIKKVEQAQLGDKVQVAEDSQSIAIVLKDRFLFDLGRHELKQENIHIIHEFIQIFQGLPPYAKIAIEGYTDDNPVNTATYRSNWHLSLLRALSVLEEFDKEGICKDNCEVRGYGEFRPFKPNRDQNGQAIDENQSQNRRVVVRIF